MIKKLIKPLSLDFLIVFFFMFRDLFIHRERIQLKTYDNFTRANRFFISKLCKVINCKSFLSETCERVKRGEDRLLSVDYLLINLIRNLI